ncbi:hypothetical protein ACWDR0_02340 [Streptomyces sp. NPDC003691]
MRGEGDWRYDEHDDEQDETSEPEDMRIVGRNRKGGESSSPEKTPASQSDLAASIKELRQEFRAELARQDNRHIQALEKLRSRVFQRLTDQDERHDTVKRDIQVLFDAARNEGLRRAIEDGRATSDSHRRHHGLSQDYRRLVLQEVLFLGRMLCPPQAGSTEADLRRRRAEAAREVVKMLFDPLDRPMDRTPEQFTAELRKLNLATGDPGFPALFATAYRRAAALRDTVGALPHSARLDFRADPTALPADHYEVWDPGQTGGGHPEFLIGPAYVMVADKPQPLTQPIVFVAPASRPGAGR